MPQRALLAATVLGEDLGENPDPNTALEIDGGGLGTANMVLNAQEVHPDGSLSVMPISISVATELFNATLRVGPATCGVVEGDDLVPAP